MSLSKHSVTCAFLKSHNYKSIIFSGRNTSESLHSSHRRRCVVYTKPLLSLPLCPATRLFLLLYPWRRHCSYSGVGLNISTGRGPQFHLYYIAPRVPARNICCPAQKASGITFRSEIPLQTRTAVLPDRTPDPSQQMRNPSSCSYRTRKDLFISVVPQAVCSVHIYSPVLFCCRGFCQGSGPVSRPGTGCDACVMLFHFMSAEHLGKEFDRFDSEF